ncbi:CAP domain-containing protein [Vibrio sp. S9_S30]|uniref:CAP domain-containing protein n=1 Tax=Vibrio sp. S9_S30 TaxID=2720226 RepID=UPI001680969E|nr:CAP domain-containing protein [Vibrio sp. S9_S30]MBD1556419.1 CAP domain-containing protein [Vibrio sp. S9_S30]
MLYSVKTGALLALSLSFLGGCGNENDSSSLTKEEATLSKPTTSKPTTSKPPTSKPPTLKPTTSKPTTSKPTTSKPTTSKPPTSKPPTSKPPTSKPPTSKPPTSKPPTSKPNVSPVELDAFAKEMLEEINRYRASTQVCGGRTMPAVAPLVWNSQLEKAAYVHSSNMANYNFFDHNGLDGTTPSDRVKNAGYNWSYTGENIAAGQSDIRSVMKGWMESKGHCENIMKAEYKEVGAAMVENRDAMHRTFWTQVFGSTTY